MKEIFFKWAAEQQLVTIRSTTSKVLANEYSLILLITMTWTK